MTKNKLVLMFGFGILLGFFSGLYFLILIGYSLITVGSFVLAPIPAMIGFFALGIGALLVGFSAPTPEQQLQIDLEEPLTDPISTYELWRPEYVAFANKKNWRLRLIDSTNKNRSQADFLDGDFIGFIFELSLNNYTMDDPNSLEEYDAMQQILISQLKEEIKNGCKISELALKIHEYYRDR